MNAGNSGRGHEVVGVRVIERIGEHYEVWEIEGGLGRTYKWHPEMAVIECECGRRWTHKRVDLLGASVSTCGCGKDDTGRIREELVVQLVDEERTKANNRHPWRHWHPSGEAGVPF